jgi:Fic family protein
VAVEWSGRKAHAFVPDTLRGFVPELSEGTVRRTERAAAAVRRVGDLASRGLEVAARLLLRAEGVASSHIEGIDAPVDEVAVAAVDESVGGSAAWVADNLSVIDDALAGHRPITARALWRWHERLMCHSDLAADDIGRWRDRQGWVGGATPLTAAYVAPPAGEVGRLMDDLVAFMRDQEIDPITHAGLVHAQFETIHPFADGNGRIGRILIARLLRDRLDVPVPPPVSVQFAGDVGGYLSGLVLFRQGQVDSWTAWFADAVEQAAERTVTALSDIEELMTHWADQAGGLRRDAAARRLIPHLAQHPVVNAAIVAELLNVSEQTARVALSELETLGVLSQLTSSGRPAKPGRPRQWWVASGLLGLLGR